MICQVEICIKTKQSLVSDRQLKNYTRAILKYLRQDGEVEIILVGRAMMRRLNLDYRGVDRVTDVLSFAWQEDKILLGQSLGQIYLCPAQIVGQAKEFDVSAREELKRMLAHGILHLLGYDHQDKKRAEKMFSIQEKLVKICQ